MFNRKIDNRIRDIAAYYGLTVVFSDKGKPYSPATMTIRFKSRSDAVHDIAHYAVATEEEREQENFGLGTDPDFRKFSNETYPFKDCQEIEEAASALGIYWEQQIGMDFLKTASLHNWPGMDSIHMQLTRGKRTRNMDINAPLYFHRIGD